MIPEEKAKINNDRMDKMELMIIISFLGSRWWIGAITILMMWRKKSWRFGLIVLGGLVIGEGLKRMVMEPRPIGMKVIENSWAFPSGHALNSTVFYGLLFLEFKKWRQRWLILLMPIIIGLSRIGLGVHYWWDVVAGWILGTGWVMASKRIFRIDSGNKK